MTAPAQPADEFLGQVHPLTIEGLPDGYEYGATRYADVILQRAFPGRFENLREALGKFEPTLDERHRASPRGSRRTRRDRRDGGQLVGAIRVPQEC